MHSTAHWIVIRCTVVVLIVTAMFTVASYSTAFAKAKVTQPLILALQHVPTGIADLRWSSTDHTLVVTMTVSGLAPNSTHPATLQQDPNNSMISCDNPHHGKIIYNLNVLKADKFGNVTPVSTTIPHVSTGIPAQGWYIAILGGSQSSQKRIACGDIVPGGIPHGIAPPPNLLQSKQENPLLTNTPTTKDQLLHVFLGRSADDNQSVIGNATLSLNNNALTVTISLGLLVPNSKYVAQIGNGTCEAQGPIVFPLNTFNADKNGQSSSPTTIQSVSISSISKAPWYINVYEAPSNNNVTSQASLDPIACGNFSMAVALPSLPRRGTPQNFQGFVPCCKH